jgi:uncharacterized protein (TIGR00661 family)
MKVLYAIQGTGNGHLSRAEDIVPYLRKRCQVDILVSGTQSQLTPSFSIDYQLRGMSFMSSKKGKVDIIKTAVNTNVFKFFKEISQFPAKKYDLIISDFEPISAWSAKYHGVKSVELSHQAAVSHPNSPKPIDKHRIGNFILGNYCPSPHKYGFHFESYAPSIFTPVIRENIRELESENRGHYTVYLPAYHDDFIVQTLMNFQVEWHVFSKYATCRYRVNNVWVNPIDADNFTDSLRTSEGVLCGAGFELPAEALFLNKKLMVIPMMGQYEQLCNAESLKKIGVLVLDKLCLLHRRTISLWLMQSNQIVVNYPNRTEQIIDTIFNDLTPLENASSTPQLIDLVGI